MRCPVGDDCKDGIQDDYTLVHQQATADKIKAFPT